jgi:hypothetical protein
MAYFTAPAVPSYDPKSLMALSRRRRWLLAIVLSGQAVFFATIVLLVLPFGVTGMTLEHFRHERIRRKFRRDAEARAKRTAAG